MADRISVWELLQEDDDLVLKPYKKKKRRNQTDNPKLPFGEKTQW